MRAGLRERFGEDRVRDTPISEQAIIGAIMGAAMNGLRPVAELMFSDFFAVTWDMVANQIAKTRYMTDGQIALPLVLRRDPRGRGQPVVRLQLAKASGTPQRGNIRVKISVRAECRYVYTPSTKGELAEKASSSGR